MISNKFLLAVLSPILFCSSIQIHAESNPLPEKMQTIMNQDKYKHSSWGIYVKDSATGQEIYDLNSQKLTLPASTTKLFSVAALFYTFGENYRFKTPVYAVGTIKDKILTGNLVLVAQGDLTMGGRQDGLDKIAYTKLDHIIANNVPGVILTEEDPLYGFKQLAKQVHDSGIEEINGNVLIDDRLFEITTKREMILSPIMINENLIDFVINPSEIGKTADFTWRPQVEGYEVTNEVKTVDKNEDLSIQISSDGTGKKIVVKGSIPLGQKDLVRTFSIKDPIHFAKSAFIQTLRAQGIKINTSEEPKGKLPAQNLYLDMKPVALWTSPPLSEYGKLILKVSHNLGADLIPLLLAVHHGEKSFDEGMKELGKFTMKEVGLANDEFVFLDGAGGDENRLTPSAEVQLLQYVRKQSPDQFLKFYNALPILGVDGSLEDFGKNTPAAGKARAKPGTGFVFNTATSQFFLTTQTFAGYIEGKNGHTYNYMVGVSNAHVPTVEDVFAVFEDLSQITNAIYETTD